MFQSGGAALVRLPAMRALLTHDVFRLLLHCTRAAQAAQPLILSTTLRYAGYFENT